MIKKGRFITFEGGEGVGKSTQVKILADKLSAAGIDVILTREPGGSLGAEEIRDLLVKGSTDKFSPMTEALLHNAARAEHLTKTVKPAINVGKWVLSDRYADSTIAYQGHGQGVDMKTLLSIHSFATGNFWPDLTIILDGNELERAAAREDEKFDKEDRYERMGKSFHDKLRESFLKIANNNPERCKVVSAAGTVEDVAKRIWKIVDVK
ncbi:MAG: dTMP kinase [Kordiimonadaceae bacterium]|nr:dTMP kinase [Kordiimonadaceae bacterium]MBT7605801.1 dTMP kinase [Kordiimonadaceae bacterium]